MDKTEYTIENNPRIRLPTIDSGKIRNNKTHMIALLEIDITNIRKQIREKHKKGIFFSFTACIIKILGDCINSNRLLNARLKSERKLIVFDDVDICFSIERKIAGGFYPFPLIIRSVNKKGIQEIDQEITKEINRKVYSESELFMPKNLFFGELFLKLFYFLPSFIRITLMKIMINNPIMAQKQLGSVGFATVNMNGKLSGWTLPTKNPYSIYVSLGSISKKPWIIEDRIEARDILNVSVIFDHNVIDGNPARSFVNEFVKRIDKINLDLILNKQTKLTTAST